MSVDARLLTASSNDVTSEQFNITFQGYLSFPVIEAGGHSTLNYILSKCSSKVSFGTIDEVELYEYDSYFIEKEDFEQIELPSYVVNEYHELLKDVEVFTYLVIQPF